MVLAYAPGVYQPDSTIADLVLRGGMQRAQMQQEGLSNLGNTIANIPIQQRQQAMAQQEMALKAAEAKRQDTLATIQQQGFEYANKQRDAATQALTSDPNLDPARITDSLRATGADADTIAKVLKTADDLRQSKVATLNQQRAHYAQYGLSAYPFLGTPQEPTVMNGIFQSMANDEKQGLIQPGTAQKAIAQYKADPSSARSMATSAILMDPAATKTAQDTVWKVTPLKEGEKAYVGLGYGGQGGIGPVAEAGYKPGSVEAYLQAKYPGQDISKLSPGQITSAKAEFAESSMAPTERTKAQYETDKLAREFAGGPGSEIHSRAVVSAEKLFDAAGKPSDALEQQATKVKTLLTSGNRNDDAVAPMALLGMISDRARVNPGNIAQITGGQTYISQLEALASKFKANPNAAIIPDDVRRQMLDTVNTLSAPAKRADDLINSARQKLVTAPVAQHPAVLAQLHQDLTAVNRGQVGVKDPSGKTHYFDTQAAADEFSAAISK